MFYAFGATVGGWLPDRSAISTGYTGWIYACVYVNTHVDPYLHEQACIYIYTHVSTHASCVYMDGRMEGCMERTGTSRSQQEKRRPQS